MADVLRSCTKTGCRWPAAASLSYRYATRQVWLLDLSPATDPSLYDLCPHHADHLVVPKGWERVDDRTQQEVMVEPSAFDRAEAARLRQPTTIHARNRELVSAGSAGPGGPRNRYADLVEQLPRLAAEAAAHDAQPAAQESAPGASAEASVTAAVDEALPETSIAPGEDAAGQPEPASAAPADRPVDRDSAAQVGGDMAGPADGPVAGPTPPAPPVAVDPAASVTRRPAPAMPSRDLAPMPPGEPLWQEPAAPLDSTDSGDRPEDLAPLPGQLAIPVDDLIESSGGVVVAFDFAGGRRRTPRS